MKRAHNEDSFYLPESERLAIVADGMGGHASGEVASRMAVETIAGFFKATQDDQQLTWPFKIDHGNRYDINRMVTAIKLANLKIHEQAQKDPRCHGMGTTVVSTLFLDDALIVGHVGDSRLYRRRDGVLEAAHRGPLAAQRLHQDEAPLARRDRGVPAQERHRAGAGDEGHGAGRRARRRAARSATSICSAPTACRAWSRTRRSSRSRPASTTSTPVRAADRRRQQERRPRQHHRRRRPRRAGVANPSRPEATTPRRSSTLSPGGRPSRRRPPRARPRRTRAPGRRPGRPRRRRRPGPRSAPASIHRARRDRTGPITLAVGSNRAAAVDAHQRSRRIAQQRRLAQQRQVAVQVALGRRVLGEVAAERRRADRLAGQQRRYVGVPDHVADDRLQAVEQRRREHVNAREHLLASPRPRAGAASARRECRPRARSRRRRSRPSVAARDRRATAWSRPRPARRRARARAPRQVDVGDDLGVHDQHRPGAHSGRALATPPPVPRSSDSTE